MIIGGIVVLILAILGVWYFASSPPGSVPVAQTQGEESGTSAAPASPSNTAAAPAKGSNTFRSIFTQSGNNACEYSGLDGSSQIDSVVYIADGKMRGEFRTMSGGVTKADLMVYDGGYLYAWQEGSATGKKTSIKSLADLPQAIPQDLTSGAIYGTSADNVGWDCHAWAKDAKLLTVPSYVKFSAGS